MSSDMITPTSTAAASTRMGEAGPGAQDATATAPVQELPGVFAAWGRLPVGAFVTEAGLAELLGKCKASIKAAVRRGELPRPAKLMGKNTWTAGTLIKHMEARLDAEARKFGRLHA